MVDKNQKLISELVYENNYLRKKLMACSTATCNNCDWEGYNIPYPEKCPNCGSKNVDYEHDEK